MKATNPVRLLKGFRYVLLAVAALMWYVWMFSSAEPQVVLPLLCLLGLTACGYSLLAHHFIPDWDTRLAPIPVAILVAVLLAAYLFAGFYRLCQWS